MKLPCPIKAPCLDDANPFQNLSSEAPDVNHFFAYGSGPGSILPGRGTGPGGVGPTPGGNWSAECETENGVITCVGTTQEEADLCVARLGQRCTQVPDGGTPGTPTTPSGDPLFLSTLQQCAAICPDGSSFTFQVAAGAFVAESQILADREALSYACRQAQILKVCFGSLSNTAACVGRPFSATVTVTGGTGFTYSIVGGSLPPGITLSSSGSTVLLSGTPTLPGNYAFSIRVVNSRGNFMVKSFTLFVLGFTNSAIPSANTGVAFTFTFTASGGTSPYTFTTTSGALPTGLTLSTAGVLSGTPTVASSYSYTVQIADSAGRTCSKAYTQAVAGKIGYRICDLATCVALWGPELALGGAVPSAFPAWDGIFDLDSFNGGFPIKYFIGQSMAGFAVSADQNVLYPAGAWQASGCLTFLQFNGATWFLTIADSFCNVTAAIYTLAKVDPVDPSGTYTQLFGPGPTFLSIVNNQTATCCADAGNAVSAVFDPAAPAQLRVKDFAAFTAAIGACPGCTPQTGQPLWDGTLPVKCTTGAANLKYWLSGTGCPQPSAVIIPARSFAGFEIHAGVLGDNAPRISLDFVPSNPWTFQIRCIGIGPDQIIWGGVKATGDLPQGTYIRTAGVGAGPDCVTIESF